MTPLLLAIAAAAGVTFASADFGAAPIPAGTLPGNPAVRPEQPAPKQPAPVTAVAAEVMVLHGTNDNSGIDPQIGRMPALSKPPFSSYNSYKQLARTTLQLQKGSASAYKLPTGRDLQVTFKNVVQAQGEPPRFVIDASIQKPDGKAFLPQIEVSAKPGEWFFVGGQEYKGGGLVIGIKVNP